MLSGAMGADQSFEQRVAGEAIRPVQPRAGDLAHGKQPGQIGRAVQCGRHTAALIMGGGHKPGLALW